MSRRFVFAFCVVFFGCSASRDEGTTPSGDASPTTDASSDAASDAAPAEGGIDFDGALPDTPPPVDMPAAAVYAHSADTLYKLDPDSKAVTTIGKFNGCSGVVDIALDAKSNLYASATGIYKVDTTTAKCTLVGGGAFAGNSLSFVPAGVLDATNEVLVTYQGGDYYRVDLSSGSTTLLGSLPDGYSSSGDIVAVKGGGTYLTVNGNGCGDCLLEVNPKTGAMIKNWGPIGASSAFGIAFWAGSVYAFTDAGKIFEITFGKTTITSTEIPIPMKPSGLSFWGAGSTTVAPVTKVK